MKQELWGYIKILLKLISEENGYFPETYGNMAYMY